MTSDPTCENLSKETQNPNLKECMHSDIHCSVIKSIQAMEATCVPINR